jgi:hypothetical protein
MRGARNAVAAVNYFTQAAQLLQRHDTYNPVDMRGCPEFILCGNSLGVVFVEEYGGRLPDSGTQHESPATWSRQRFEMIESARTGAYCNTPRAKRAI